MRAGKISAMEQLSITQTQQMKQSNPEINQITTPLSQAITVDPRNDVAPYNDIRVREALQMALDLPTFAKTYYNWHCLT